MLRSAHFRGRALTALAALLSVAATAQQPDIVRDGDRWRRDIHGSAPARKRLRINAHGPVTLQAGTGSTLTYTASASVRARSESEASRVLKRYEVTRDIVRDRAALT